MTTPTSGAGSGGTLDPPGPAPEPALIAELATVAEHLKALAEECDVPKKERQKYMLPKGREYRVALHWRAVGLREAALILERTDAV